MAPARARAARGHAAPLGCAVKKRGRKPPPKPPVDELAARREAKRASGGKRAGEKKQREREAARTRAAAGEDWREKWLEELSGLGDPAPGAAGAHAWLGRAALLIVQATMRDTAIPPEQMRRDVMRQIEQASKVLDPAQLSEQIAELERALEELQANARRVASGEDR